MVENLSTSFEVLLPVVVRQTANNYNFWDGVSVNSSKNGRTNKTQDKTDDFKKNLLMEIYKTVNIDPVCMLTGTTGLVMGKTVVKCAHIIPACKRSCTKQLLENGFTAEDVDSVRNGLFLSFNCEVAVDKLWLGFIKNPNPVVDGLVAKVYNFDECKKLPLFEGSNRFVFEFDGLPLNLGEHNPLKTALFLHSYFAYLKSVTAVGAPSFYGTPQRSTEFIKQVKLHINCLNTAAEREARLNDEASDEMSNEVEEIEEASDEMSNEVEEIEEASDEMSNEVEEIERPNLWDGAGR